MPFSKLYADCRAFGWKVNEEAGTLDGLTASGVAFRVLPPQDTVKLAVRMADKKCAKLQALLTENPAFAELTVTPTDNGIELRFPMTGITAEALKDVVTTAADRGVEQAAASFTDKLESSREPLKAYLRGAVGALLGALIGAVPWILAQWLLSWNLWMLGALISIASFYGYAFLWGAHATRFAFGSVIVCTLLTTVGYIIGNFFLGGGYAYLLDYCAAEGLTLTWQLTLQWLGTWCGSDLLFSLVCSAAALVGIRGRILAYTHEHIFLRGRR